MRRSDREITRIDELLSVMQRCDVCHIGLNAENVPYIVPLNFGVETHGEKITLYFHSAKEGRKLELVRSDNRASFVMDTARSLWANKDACRATMEYESVMGTGLVFFVSDPAEKERALSLLVAHYMGEEVFTINSAVTARTEVLKLEVETVTGKRNIKE